MIANASNKLTKLCHATVGQHLQLVDSQTGDVLPEVYVLCAQEKQGCRAARPGMTHGLYDDERPLFLVSLSSGRMRDLPHKSSRVFLHPLKPEQMLAAKPSSPGNEWVRLTVRQFGETSTADVNLRDTQAVHDLLGELAVNEATVLEVAQLTEAERLETILLARWRDAVAKEQTLMSFEEFKKAQ